MTTTRRAILAEADDLLKQNPEPRRVTARVRYRGGRPALNWLRKNDAAGAAALWQVARARLPTAANDNASAAANDNRADVIGLGVDRRKDGKPRGRSPDKRSLEAYLALPAVKPRLGDPEPQRTLSGNWDGASRGITIKPQRDVFEFHRDCRFGFCAPAIAPGAFFLGSVGGLGQPKIGKQRGDIRRVDEPTIETPPSEVDTVIEVMLSGGDLASIGKALGAKGGYADRKGKSALLAAAKWAASTIAA